LAKSTWFWNIVKAFPSMVANPSMNFVATKRQPTIVTGSAINSVFEVWRTAREPPKYAVRSVRAAKDGNYRDNPCCEASLVSTSRNTAGCFVGD
jgi:hypothetical protein